MSSTVDANILFFGSNDSAPEFAVARALVEHLAAGPDLVYLFWPVIMGYLRIVTHPGVLPKPLNFAEAKANIAALVGRPHVRVPGEGDGFWEVFCATTDAGTRGNAVPDAHLAALMRQHGVSLLYSRDRGFRRYSRIQLKDPFGT